ncbi:MAG: hypothetical protein INQ03_14250 [Candidatus Heimdallarchaeota archaeon]|nr:hypothetical protein [Candidatus Heimdallarchaeota archaeon]
MNKRIIIAIFMSITGSAMMSIWLLLLGRGLVVEISTDPISLVFHLIAEFTCAFLLLLSAWGMVRSFAWAEHVGIFAFGMTCYSVISSSSYYLIQQKFYMNFVFVIIFVAIGLSMYYIIKNYGIELIQGMGAFE